jgi:hypothetical protein
MKAAHRKIKLQDKALSELAEMFASSKLVAYDPTPGAKLLDPSRLDFTVKSLRFVDDYLAKNNGLTFPLGKVQKFLDNGREDSVQFFAKVML